MTTLRLGSRGNDVRRLQRRLRERGFNPGKIDGDFGPATEAAVLAFQPSAGLLVDGIAGPRTLAALDLVPDDSLPSVVPAVTADVVGRMFPSTPLDNIKAHLPVVLEGLVSASLHERPMVLMALATIRAETEGFVPISEGPSRYNSSPGGHLFDLYDHRADLGNQGPPDGERFRGRGFVQLTGRANYARHGRAIGLGSRLVREPELANEPKIAADLLASFLKARERPIKEALLVRDLRTARRLVNGGAHGLDRFADCYERGEALLPAI
jgi:putative chitinase